MESLFLGEMGLKAGDLPKAMAVAEAECVESPDDFVALARAGWQPSSTAGFGQLSFFGRKAFQDWVAWFQAPSEGDEGPWHLGDQARV